MGEIYTSGLQRRLSTENNDGGSGVALIATMLAHQCESDPHTLSLDIWTSDVCLTVILLPMTRFSFTNLNFDAPLHHF
jgi:ABC-type cobalamin transport system permease subunit